MIVVAGEALVDLIPGPTVTGDSLPAFSPRLGGGPYNVAITLGRLGIPTSFLSRMSTDMFGRALLDRLQAAGVDTALVQRGQEPTTLAVVGLAADGSATYGFYVTGTADRLVADPGELPDTAKALSFGTLSLVLEPGASVYESLLQRAARQEIFTALDPNIRAELIPDANAYRARFRSWLPHVALLKVSVDDARWLSANNGEFDVLSALQSWQLAGPSAVVLTQGAAGIAVLTPRGDFLTVPAAQASVIDTIGAGDTVHGALLAWLLRKNALSKARLAELTDEEWHTALSFAAAAAGVTVSRAGAEPPYPAELSVQLP